MIKAKYSKVKENPFMKTHPLKILFEDEHIIVCFKPHGIATQSRQIGRPDMISLLKNHIHQANSVQKSAPYLSVIHRLDQPVSGILVFAKTPFAAKELNYQLQNHGFSKHYRALVNNCPTKPNDTLENYMIKDSKNNTSRICKPDENGAKLARLHYQIVEKGQGYFNLGRGISQFTPSPIELDILLDTGRHHQIRVQLANIGCPIIGDTKYNPHAKPGNVWQEIKLCAYKLEFKHPKTKKQMSFSLINE